jgi:hypothetical protein
MAQRGLRPRPPRPHRSRRRPGPGGRGRARRRGGAGAVEVEQGQGPALARQFTGASPADAWAAPVTTATWVPVAWLGPGAGKASPCAGVGASEERWGLMAQPGWRARQGGRRRARAGRRDRGRAKRWRWTTCLSPLEGWVGWPLWRGSDLGRIVFFGTRPSRLAQITGQIVHGRPGISLGWAGLRVRRAKRPAPASGRPGSGAFPAP